jgi:hypothetical protein
MNGSLSPSLADGNKLAESPIYNGKSAILLQMLSIAIVKTGS